MAYTDTKQDRERIASRAQRAYSSSTPAALPLDGLVVWSDIAPFLPFKRRTLTNYINTGKFPKPLQIARKLCWRAEVVREWIETSAPLSPSSN